MSNIHFVNNINEVSNLPRRDRVQFKCTNCGSIGEASVNNVFYKQRLLCNACSKDIGKKEFLAKKNSMSPEEYLMSKSTKFISSLDEIKDVVGRKFITFKCTKCGALAGNVSDRLKQKGLLLCGDCMKKHTNLERFGYEHPMFDPTKKEAASIYNKEHKEELNEARRLSVLNKYGVNNVMQVQEHKDACFESNRNNHGGILASQTEEQRQFQSERMIENHGYSDKATATNIANHGGVHNLTLPENREKLYEHQRIHKDEIQSVRDETNIKRFGKTNYMCYGEPEYVEMMISKYLDDLPDSRKNELTRLDFSEFCYALWNEIPLFKNIVTKSIISNHDLKLETDNITYKEACSLLRQKHPEWLDKTIQTFIDRYHTTHPAIKPIYVDGLQFDSDWEVYVYIYYRDKGSIIIREPKPPLIYFDSYGGDHKYYPDFMIDGRYVEVKGTQFFKDQDPTKDMISAYINPNWDEDRFRLEMDIAKCKGECIKQNAFLISKHNIKDYKDYFLRNYDYNWLQSLYYRNLIRFAFSRYTFRPLYCNTMNNGKGVTPFDVDMKQKYAPVTGKGLTPFDIKFPKKD